MYQARRPHSRFCSETCRVGSHHIRKRKEEKIRQLQDELEQTQERLAFREAKILDLESSMSEKQASLQQLKQKQHKVEQHKCMSFLSFYIKYQHRKDPVTGIKVPAINMDSKAGTPSANFIFEERQKRLSKMQRRIGTAVGEKQEKINYLQSLLQKEKEEMEAMEEALQKYQRQFSLLLKKEKKMESSVIAVSDLLPSASSTDQSIGAEDLLKKHIKTFKLPGTLGEFMGELERHMLAIALVGDPGAGKSTMTMAIARIFDLAGYRIIFYSLEIGIGKPLQDMIKRNPLSNQVRITDKGDIAAVRESAKAFDLVMVDSFGKLDCKAEEWDRLRQDFPNTIFLSIFQKTSSGSSRGGASVDYDASMVIDMTREKGSGKRVAHMRKSRYGTQDWHFYPEENRIEKT